MQTTCLAKPVPLDLPFVGREKEVVRLNQLHARRKHVLILGPAGVGKSALIRHVATALPLLICSESVRLAEICQALEPQLGLEAAALRLVRRKNRLLAALARAGRTVVFDGLGWTAPRLSSFLECVCQRMPVWVVTRSDHSWNIGHFWPLRSRFERVELSPFQLQQTRALMEAAVRRGLIPTQPQEAVARLHHLASGNGRRLCGLLACLRGHHHDLATPHGLRLLELDRRIESLRQPSGLVRAEP